MTDYSEETSDLYEWLWCEWAKGNRIKASKLSNIIRKMEIRRSAWLKRGCK